MKGIYTLIIGVVLSLPGFGYGKNQKGSDFQDSKQNRSELSDLCVVELQTKRGKNLERFVYQDCQRAYEECTEELRWRQQRDRNPKATCEIVHRPDHKKAVLIDEVHFFSRSTHRAVQMCKRYRTQDYRCEDSPQYSCSPCSDNQDSGHSRYLVYAHKRKLPRRQYINTLHFYGSNSNIAYRRCELVQLGMRQCQIPSRYECTPCTNDWRNDHSQFDIYKINH